MVTAGREQIAFILRQAEEAVRQGHAAGRDPPKALKPARQRQMVDDARSTSRVSIRRACRALPVERSTYHYRFCRAGQAQLIERIKEIAATRVRYGYRRIHVLRRQIPRRMLERPPVHEPRRRAAKMRSLA
jgi:putative transposase